MFDVLHVFHAHNRFLISVLALACVLKLIVNLLRKKEYGRSDAMLVRLYSVVLTIQFVVGILLLYNVGTMAAWDMSQLRLQLEHATTQLIAVGLSHAAVGVYRKTNGNRSTRALIFVAASFALIIVGVGRLKGFEYWMNL